MMCLRVERYSPQIADALSVGGTRRAATRKSSGVRATRTPRAPRTAVTTATAMIAPPAATAPAARCGSTSEGDPYRLMTERIVVLVNGLPGAGKTTLARTLSQRLRLPLLSKDTIKEAHADVLGTEPPPGWSQRRWNAALGVERIRARGPRDRLRNADRANSAASRGWIPSRRRHVLPRDDEVAAGSVHSDESAQSVGRAHARGGDVQGRAGGGRGSMPPRR